MKYTDDFEALWKAYGPVKNSSKIMAFKAFTKLTVEERPEQSLFLAEISCYNKWIDEESKKQGRPYPKCHMATWLNQRKFEGWEDDARAILAAQEANLGATLVSAYSWVETGAWPRLEAALISSISDVSPVAVFESFIRQTTFIPGNPPEIKCPSKFHRDQVENKFGIALKRAFGEVKLTVS